MHSETTAEITKALVKVQSTLAPVGKSLKVEIATKSGGKFSYDYADLKLIWEACKEPLTTNNLAISQLLEVTEEGKQVLSTMLLHESGEWLSSTIKVDPNEERNPQALGRPRCCSKSRRGPPAIPGFRC